MTELLTMMNRIKSRSAEMEPELIDYYRNFHRFPELSFRESETSNQVQKILDAWKIDFSTGWADTGVVGIINPKSTGKTIVLRADMDALPITEKTDLNYISTNQGVMHACGHDIHMACLLGAAKILDELAINLNGRFVLLFQPGEEKLPGGAERIIRQNLFTLYKPDYIIGQHVAPEIETGRLGFIAGPYMASSDEIYITVRSKGGHGALPQLTPDTVFSASQIVVGLQQVVSRFAPPLVPTVLSFGNILTKGGATNVIPEEVKIEGTFRTMDEHWRFKAHNRIRQIVNGISQASGVTADVEIVKGYPVLENNTRLTDMAIHAARKFAGEEKITKLEIRMTSEDFAWYSHQFPSLFYRLGVGFENQPPCSLHSPEFVANEKAIAFGSAFMAYLAVFLASVD